MEKFQKGPLRLKFDMGMFFEMGNTKMMVPKSGNEIFNVILAFEEQWKQWKNFKMVRLV